MIIEAKGLLFFFFPSLSFVPKTCQVVQKTSCAFAAYVWKSSPDPNATVLQENANAFASKCNVSWRNATVFWANTGDLEENAYDWMQKCNVSRGLQLLYYNAIVLQTFFLCNILGKNTTFLMVRQCKKAQMSFSFSNAIFLHAKGFAK